MDTAAIFKNGRSQAIRLPRAYRFKTRRVRIARFDDMVILTPPGKEWTILENSLRLFTDDFMARRNQTRRPQRRKKL